MTDDPPQPLVIGPSGPGHSAAAGWLPFLLQTTDSLFPTGAYAHSGGLESLVQLGLVTDAPTLAAFLRTHALPALAWYELPYLGFSLEAAARGDLPALVALDREYGAGKLAREAREASAGIGTQRLRMLLRLEALAAAAPDERGARMAVVRAFEAAVARGEARGHAAVVCGVQAHVLGVPVDAAMAAYGYGSLAGFGSAALKLIRIGQEGVQAVLAEALGRMEETVRTARGVVREDAGWGDPAWEIAGARHERAYARLFIS